MKAKSVARSFACVVLCCTAFIPRTAAAQNLYRGVTESFRGARRAIFERSEPVSQKDACVEQLSREIDWLEHQVETYGSVVPKTPDVWGESRLTKHRQEYEKQISTKFKAEGFEEGLQAAIRRSDQSFLSMAFVLNAAAEGSTVPLAGGDANGSVTQITQTQKALDLTNEPDDAIVRSTSIAKIPLDNFNKTQISLEPTIVNEQLNRYLNHLNELRRINEGDDIADTPGYALNLIRIPVSVLPGHRTMLGYGAEASFTLQPVLSNDLLPSTVRNLVINDVADQFAVPLATVINNDQAGLQTTIDLVENSNVRSTSRCRPWSGTCILCRIPLETCTIVRRPD